MFNQYNTLYLISLSILTTSLLDIIWILYGEVTCQSLLCEAYKPLGLLFSLPIDVNHGNIICILTYTRVSYIFLNLKIFKSGHFLHGYKQTKLTIKKKKIGYHTHTCNSVPIESCIFLDQTYQKL